MGIHVDPDELFHVLLDGVVVEMTLDQLSDGFERGQVALETLLWQEGLGEWLRLDVVLAAIDSQTAPPSFAPPVAEPSEMYAVLMGATEVKQMSLEQLNDAYRLSLIDDETSVWQPGLAGWIQLGELLGEAEAPAPSHHYQQQAGWAGRPQPSSFAPVTYHVSRPPQDILAELPLHPPTVSPWFRRTLFAACSIAAAITFFQTGTLHDVLGRRALAATSTWMPAPSVDTPMGTTRFLEGLRSRYDLDKLARTEPLPKKRVSQNAASPAPTPAEQTGSNENAQVPVAATAPALTSSPSGLPPSIPEPSGADSKAPSPELPQGDLRGQVLPSLPSAPAKTTPSPAVRRVKPSRPSSSSKYHSTSNDPYDPMNGNL